MNKPAWIVLHLAALAMLFCGGWLTVAGFLLFTLLPGRSTAQREAK